MAEEEKYHYQASLRWESGRTGRIGLENKPDLLVATPPEFGGPEGIHSPEDLFVAASLACFMSTFITMTQKMRLAFVSLECRGVGTLAQGEGGEWMMTQVELFPRVVVTQEKDIKKMERAIGLVERSCVISNSLKSRTVVQPEVLAAA